MGKCVHVRGKIKGANILEKKKKTTNIYLSCAFSVSLYIFHNLVYG